MSVSNAGTTRKLAEFVADAKYKDLPPEAVERTKTMFLDTIGVALAGTVVGDTGRILLKYVKEMGGVPEASVIGGGFRTNPTNAALANGILGHALDFDDWEWSGHPSCMMVATSLALGEKVGAPGKTAILAYVLGVEVYDKIAAGCADLRGRGWHGTAIHGTMGAAAAAAKMLGLSASQLVSAWGVAASTAMGMVHEHGSMVKPYQVGKAARNGVEAALLAKDGFHGREDIIETPLGLYDCLIGLASCDFPKMTRNLGNPFHIVSPGLGLKPYPCRVPEHRGIEAILELRKELGFTYSDVDWLEMRISRRKQSFDIVTPRTGLEGKFSHRYVAARVLLDGKLTLESFTNEKINEPVVKEALDKVRLVLDETIPDALSKSFTPITVKLKDGRTMSKRVDITRGDPRNPMPMDMVLEKYRDNASRVLGKGDVERSLSLIQNLDKVDDVTELMRILAKPAEVVK